VKITQVACGEKHTVFLSEEGKVFVSGTSDCGQLGLGDDVHRIASAPILLDHSTIKDQKVKIIASGPDATVLITEESEIFGFGLGATLGQTANLHVPTSFGKIPQRNISRVSIGSSMVAILTEVGEVYTW
jgi:alpha-tubulin suppressor-like RCC1 family protein